MGIQHGARFPARSADALPITLYGHFAKAIYRIGLSEASAAAVVLLEHMIDKRYQADSQM